MHRAEPSFTLPEALNIADHFLEARIREGKGDRTALHLPDGRLTYAEVAALACRWSQVLAGLGVRQDERVMLALPDGADFVGALFGILKLGAVGVMVNPYLKPREIAQLLPYVRPHCCIVHRELAQPFLDQRQDPWPRRFLVTGGELAGHPSFEGESRGLSDDYPTVATHRDAPALWLFSGGTTGRPKAVVQSHGAFANTTELYAVRTLGWQESDITLSVPKLYFGYATGSNLFFPFAVGASAALFPEHPTAEVLFQQIRQHRPTVLINVPTMIQRMVSHPQAEQQDLSCLRFATSAGEALPVSLYQRWKQTFGVELLDGLGTAEMWHVFLTNRPGAVRPGTLGQVVEGFEIRIADDQGVEVETGEVGRLGVRGNSRALGYWQNLPRTMQAFQGEWFVGGDLVSQDQDGYVTYCGRADDVLKVGGKWLSPAEVEGCLLAHPSVKECAVVGALDHDGLQKPFAFVLAHNSAQAGAGTGGDAQACAAVEAELKAFALERLSAYKHPRRVIVLAEFPRTHLGKVDRGALKTRAETLSTERASEG